MSRYIDADKLIKELERHGFQSGGALGRHDGNCELASYIVEKHPVADVKEIVHGYWIYTNQGLWIKTTCSECGSSSTEETCYVFGMSNFCPNCGADMREHEV